MTVGELEVVERENIKVSYSDGGSYTVSGIIG